MQDIEAEQKELAAQGWKAPVEPAAATFQPFKWKMDITTDTIAIGLVDDRYGHHILVLVAKVQASAFQALHGLQSDNGLVALIKRTGHLLALLMLCTSCAKQVLIARLHSSNTFQMILALGSKVVFGLVSWSNCHSSAPVRMASSVAMLGKHTSLCCT